jgi:peptidoglycan hydrolase-like protein with peptidoglycan-binding domain
VEISSEAGEKVMSKIYTYNEKLKYARELRGWSQEELARRVGFLAESMGHRGTVLDVSTISRWERGRNSPSPFYRQLLCSLFEMNAEELGLLAADNPLQQDTISFQDVDASEIAFSECNVPVAERYDRGTSDNVLPLAAQQISDVVAPSSYRAGQDTIRQDIHTIENLPSGSAPQSFFVRRRKLLTALLASATLAGGALFAGKLLLSPPDSILPTTISTVSRHWPEVVPDIHKQLARVRVIQWMLNARGWSMHIDGIFWTRTENAVMLFQGTANIPVTTTVNGPTWERLILTSEMVDEQTMDQGSQVKALQEMLNMYGASPRLHVDGGFGPLTRAATRHFQQTHQLTVTGQADLNTWCLLAGGSLK